MHTGLRIGYACHDPFPAHGAHTHQVFWTLVEVARRGVPVTLTIPSLDAPPGADARAVLGDYYGVPPDAMPPDFSVDVIGSARAGWLGHLWFDRRVPTHLASRQYDIVWTRNLGAAAHAVRAGLPTLFETYRPDLATRAIFAPWRRPLLASPHLRGIITHSRLAARAFIGAGVPEARCLVAYNGFAPSMMEPVLDRIEARRRLDLPVDPPLVVYAGHADKRKGMDALVRLAAAIPEARFVILGLTPGTGEADVIGRMASVAGASNLVLRPRVGASEVAPYLYAADCLIIPPTDEPLNRFRRTVVPIKLFSYLAAGRPILAPRLPDIEEVLTDGQTAQLVPANDGVEAAQALRRLLADRALQDRLASACRSLSARYTWAARADRILQFISRDVLAPHAEAV